MGILLAAAAALFLLANKSRRQTSAGPSREVLGRPQPGEVWTLVFQASRSLSQAEWRQAMAGIEAHAQVMGFMGSPTSHSVTLRYTQPVVLVRSGFADGGDSIQLVAAVRAPVQ